MRKKPKFKKKQKFGDKIAVEENRQPSMSAPLPDIIECLKKDLKLKSEHQKLNEVL